MSRFFGGWSVVLVLLSSLVACGADAGSSAAGDERPSPLPPGHDGGAGTGVTGGITPPGGDSGPACAPDPTFAPGRAIAAPADGSWTFIDVPESKCMNGSPTGFGVSLSPSSTQVLVYFEGGGACFDLVTCLAASHASGFGTKDLAGALKGPASGVLSRTDTANPFRDWSFVFIPYCTGDVHAGDNPNGPSNRAHVGFANARHALERLIPSFPRVDRVVVSGSSAGGFGAAYNFDQVARAFPCARVDLLDDAGIPMADAYLKPCLQRLWRDTWRLDKTLPVDCADCGAGEKGGISRVLPFIAHKYPASHFAYLSGTEDATIRTFYGYGYSDGCASLWLMDANLFHAGLLDVRDDVLAGTSNTALYLVGGFSATQHTFLAGDLTKTTTAGVTLPAWLDDFAAGHSSWRSEGP